MGEPAFLPGTTDEYLVRMLADGRRLDVVPLTLGRARICVAPSYEALGYDDGW